MVACFLRSQVGSEVQVNLPTDIVRPVLARCDNLARPQTFLFHRAERHLLPTLLALYEKFHRVKVRRGDGGGGGRSEREKEKRGDKVSVKKRPRRGAYWFFCQSGQQYGSRLTRDWLSTIPRTDRNDVPSSSQHGRLHRRCRWR